MSTRKLRIGFVGAGRMGTQHALACAKAGHETGFVYDVSTERAQSLATELKGARVVSSLDRLPWKDVDAVIITSPPVARGPVELAAIRTGTAFFVEKPVGIDATQVTAVIRALRGQPVIHSVGYMSRYRDSVRLAKQALTAKPILAISAHWVCGQYNKPWWSDRGQSGGPFNEQCTHFVDLCRYFGGELSRVTALNAQGSDQAAAVAFVLASGGVGTLLYSCEAAQKSMAFSLVHREGDLTLRGYDLEYQGSLQSAAEAMDVELRAFCTAVGTNDQHLIASSFEDALRTQLTVDAIKLALNTGKPVNVPPLEGSHA